MLSDEEIIDTEKHTKVIVHTYTGERYTAQGKANVKNETEDSDMVIELKREIEQIYGFYSRHSLKISRQDDKNVVEMYGYLEGYAEGEDQNLSIGTMS